MADDPYAGVADALRSDRLADLFKTAVVTHHIDVTCDGCETEPIIGNR
jgi:hypothetical protein